MGLLGPDRKEEDGEEYEKEGETENRGIADRMCVVARGYGYKAHVKPVMRGDKTFFQVWVSVMATRGMPKPPKLPPQEQYQDE